MVGSAHSGTIINSHSTGDVTGNSYVGGLAGDGKSITNSYATGDVFGTERVGGLAGRLYLFGTISDSYSTGNVKATGTGSDDYIGGLIGYAWGDISNSYSSGDVQGDNDIGGLVGRIQGAGGAQLTISNNSYSTGEVTGLDNVGGLVGQIYSHTDGYGSASITNSYSSSKVNGNNNIGGLVGINTSSSIKNSYTTGDVTGLGNNLAVGGFIGNNKGGTIQSSYAKGSVTGYKQVGGFVGNNEAGDIKNSYALGNVNGDDSIGGFAGNNADVVKNVYSTGVITGNTNVGGLTGKGTTQDSYYDKTKNVAMADEINYGKTSVELKNIDTFSNAGWDIQGDTSMTEGAPLLTMSGSTPIWKIRMEPTIPTPVPTPDTSPTPSETPAKNQTITNTPTTTVKPKAEKTITAIINTVSIRPPTLQKVPQNFTTTKISFKNKVDKVTIISKPIIGEKTKKITQSEVKTMQNTETTIVPIGRDSLIQLINSGVTLPEGVEQEFYVVDDKRR